MVFDPNGMQLPHWQDTPVSITALGNNVYQVQLWNSEFAYYPQVATELVPGNYMSFEATTSGNSGGFLMRYNTNVSFYNVNYYSHLGAWSLPEYGIDHSKTGTVCGAPIPIASTAGGGCRWPFAAAPWS